MRTRLLCALVGTLGALAPAAQGFGAVLQVNCAAGPFLTISAAVAAAANGDTIVVEACGAPYNENVLIAGFQGLHVVAAASGDVGARPAGVGAGLNPPVAVNGAGLAGPCFDIQDAQDIKVQNFRLVNCAAGGVRVRSAQRVLILANRIVSHPAAGVLAIGTDDLQVSSNLVILTGAEGILLDATRFSTLSDNLVGRTGVAGIRLVGGSDNRVDNNEVRLAGAEGLVVSGSRARVERNTFLQSGAGIDIFVDAAGVDADVTGNSVPAGIVDAGVGTDLLNNF